MSRPSYDNHTHVPGATMGTYDIIRSAPFSAQDLAEATDEDAPADEWDEAEYDRQWHAVCVQRYEAMMHADLRKLCKARKLRVRGNKPELVERLAQDDVQKMYHSGENQKQQ